MEREDYIVIGCSSTNTAPDPLEDYVARFDDLLAK